MASKERWIAAALAALLAGCGGGTSQPPEPAPAPSPTPTTALPEALTATTNEPFYAAAIERDAIRLSGVDLPERRLPITARMAVPGGIRRCRAAYAGRRTGWR